MKKITVDTSVVRLKEKEIYGHVTQGQENVKLFQPCAGSYISKGNQHEEWESFRSRDWEAVEGFYTCPLGVLSEKDQVEEPGFCADETGSFSECVVFLLTEVLSPEAHKKLIS